MDGADQGRDPYGPPPALPAFAAPYASPHAVEPAEPPAGALPPGQVPYRQLARPVPPGYTPAPSYGQQPGYAPAPGYGPAPGYAPAPGYGPAPGYAQPSGYGQPPGYGQYPAYSPWLATPPAPSTPGIAITGLVLAFLVPVAGFVVSLVALPRTARAGAGRGLARAGVAVGAVWSVLLGLMIGSAVAVYDEQAEGARAAIVSINRSMDQADCGAFFAASTHAFRADQGIADCDDFAEAQEGWAQGGVQTMITFVSVLPSGGEAVVVTKEDYVHADGTDHADVTYQLVHRGGHWLVDAGSWG